MCLKNPENIKNPESMTAKPQALFGTLAQTELETAKVWAFKVWAFKDTFREFFACADCPQAVFAQPAKNNFPMCLFS